MALSSPVTSRGAALPNLALAQGVYYAAAGMWPLVDDHSFQLITGPKRDLWLVKTVAVLVGVIGGVLVLAGARRSVSPEIAALGAGSAAALTAIDAVYVARGRISRVYLLDSAAEAALALCWILLWLRSPRMRSI